MNQINHNFFSLDDIMRIFSILSLSLLSFSSSISLSDATAAPNTAGRGEQYEERGVSSPAGAAAGETSKRTNLRGDTHSNSDKLQVVKGEEVQTKSLSNSNPKEKDEGFLGKDEEQQEEEQQEVEGGAIKEAITTTKQERRLARCYNMSGFQDSYGDTCNDYIRNRNSWCPRAHEWTNSRTRYHARQACCTCGGGCVDKENDNAAFYGAKWHDKYGNGCEYYNSNWRCSFADAFASTQGNAKDFCCMCGGGNWRGF